MKKITIFTPTYNRAYCLHVLYKSLCKQISQDFHWLIIDDGSTDSTSFIVDEWMKQKRISIKYHFQQNKGMVEAHNTAHYIMNTELCVCMDSDDYMPVDAIESILFLWERDGYPESAGMVGLDSYENGEIVGTKLPEVKECKFSELHVNHKVSGDKKFIHNRKVFNNYLPYPSFEGEKFPDTSYLYYFIERDHQLLVYNKVFCIVKYLPDGLSMNLINQYRENPRSFAHYRKIKMNFALNYREKFRNAIHYISSSIMAKDLGFIIKSPFKFTTIIALPFGILLFMYLTYTNKNHINKGLNK